jgi:hypothetical protein
MLLTTRQHKKGVGELDERKPAHVAQIDNVRSNAQQCRPKGEAVDEPEGGLRADDGVDEARQELLREDGVFLDQLGQIVES